YPIFFLGIAIYSFGANLHKPMFFYPLSFFFLLHMYGGAVLFILAAMAFDCYVAICQLLRYSTIMIARNVAVIILLVWSLDLVLILLLFSLQIKLPWCRSSIMNVFCDNPSLLKLTCGNTTMNNVIGLFNTAVMQIISASIQIFSYVKILITCLVTRKSAAKSKALKICVSQWVIFFIFAVVGTFTILSHRFKNLNYNGGRASYVVQKIIHFIVLYTFPMSVLLPSSRSHVHFKLVIHVSLMHSKCSC
uniref:G-protein coupled receptors family 1 profile domain-containing protein n=1 Tax=Hucho hucho TaxID=62062 RepID=A0A4W5MCV0_9TELE